MYGLQAIDAANGWAMAAAGGLIVLSGLAILSFIISQLHRIVSFFEKSDDEPETEAGPTDTRRALVHPDCMPDDLEQIAKIYRTLTDPLGSPFDLQRLYTLCVENQLPHPHLSLRALRDAGLLVRHDEGRFSWSG